MALVVVMISMGYRSKYLVDYERIDDHSNMMMRFKFEPTPHMSQYLVSRTTISFTVVVQ
jgi:hypothetical protein